MVYAVSDLHGYPLDGFCKILDSAGFSDDDFLFVLGDVIDRCGDGGIDMLRWMMLMPNVQLIRGNHEQMLLECSFMFQEVTDATLARITGSAVSAMERWLINGAKPTLDSLRRLLRRDPDALDDIFDYIGDAPLYETVSLDNGDFVLTHAGLGNFSPGKKLTDYTPEELMWNRPTRSDRYFGHVHTVFGHTPTHLLGAEPGGILTTPTWTAIDPGTAEGNPPLILCLDELKMPQQEEVP